MVEAAAADRPLKPADWASLPDDKLLEVRMCDLGVTIEGTDLEARIGRIERRDDTAAGARLPRVDAAAPDAARQQAKKRRSYGYAGHRIHRCDGLT